MQTNYAFRNLAIHSLLDFQEKEFAFCFFHYFQSRGSNAPNTFLGPEHYKKKLEQELNLYEDALRHFKKEIDQVIHTTNQLAINQYIEYIKNFRLLLCNIGHEFIQDKINTWNSENMITYENKIEQETIRFFQSENRKMEHLQEYEMPESSYWALALSTPMANLKKTNKAINYNFYYSDEIPSLIDLDYIPEYIKFLKYVNEKFASVVDEYITQYEKGKIVSSSTMIVNHVDFLQAVNAITTTADNKTLSSTKKQKIKWKGTPQEFVQLFAPMITHRKIYLNKESESDSDPIVKILSDTFLINKKKGQGELSAASLSTYFKEFNSNPHLITRNNGNWIVK